MNEITSECVLEDPDLSDSWDAEPRWPAVIAVLAVAGLNTALPESLNIGPRWLFMVVVVALLIPTIITRFTNHHHLNRTLGFCLTALITVGMVASLVLLIQMLLTDKNESAQDLLRSAASLWVTNILVFALWYWRLDAGGPHCRERRPGHPDGAFLFPQMTLPPELKSEDWAPNFVDYLFLAFNTSTAFSPTDVPVLTRWAKALMMLQSIVSLTVLVLFAARAVNIL